MHQAPLPRPRRGAAAASLVCASALLLPSTATAHASPRDHHPSAAPVITWEACDADKYPVFKDLHCGRMPAPLDHADPSKGTVSVFLSRRPATHPDRRRGTVFVNPGGPGGSGSQAVARFSQRLGPEVTDVYDVVGLDPRGAAPMRVEGDTLVVDPSLGTAPLLCKRTPPKGLKPGDLFPYRPEMTEPFLAGTAALQQACAAAGNPIIDHMTTADSARDLDLARQAVGEDRMTFYGVSYGTHLGPVYAMLFPDKVRAVALDSALDPVEWTAGRRGSGARVPTLERLGSGRAAHIALDRAMTECEDAGATGCPEAPRVRATHQRLMSELQTRSFPLPGGAVPGVGEVEVGYDVYVDLVLQPLYSQAAIPQLLRDILTLSTMLDVPRGSQREAVAAKAVADVVARRVGDVRRQVEQGEIPLTPSLARVLGVRSADGGATYAAFQGVMCSDSPNPASARTWIDRYPGMERVAPGFVASWAFSGAACAGWPGGSSGAYRGPWDIKTANGMLIAQATYDPATPVWSARRLFREATGARLVTVEGGFGHGAWRQSCAAKEIRSYLLDAQLVPGEVTCAPDRPLFERPTR